MQVERRSPTRAIVLKRDSSHNQSWTGNARKWVRFRHDLQSRRTDGPWNAAESGAPVGKSKLAPMTRCAPSRSSGSERRGRPPERSTGGSTSGESMGSVRGPYGRQRWIKAADPRPKEGGQLSLVETPSVQTQISRSSALRVSKQCLQAVGWLPMHHHRRLLAAQWQCSSALFR